MAAPQVMFALLLLQPLEMPAVDASRTTTQTVQDQVPWSDLRDCLELQAGWEARAQIESEYRQRAETKLESRTSSLTAQLVAARIAEAESKPRKDERIDPVLWALVGGSVGIALGVLATALVLGDNNQPIVIR